MSEWILWQFKNIVDSFLANVNDRMEEILVRRLVHLSDKGNDCKRPISSPIGDGLFELRARAGKEQARLIYFFHSDRRIIFVHAFYKPGSAISQHDKEIASRNRKAIQEGKERAYGLNFTH